MAVRAQFADPKGNGSNNSLTMIEHEIRHICDNELPRVENSTESALVGAIKALAEREQHVMRMLYEHDMNLREIAAVLGVNESRVCELHSAAIVQLAREAARIQCPPGAGRHVQMTRLPQDSGALMGAPHTNLKGSDGTA